MSDWYWAGLATLLGFLWWIYRWAPRWEVIGYALLLITMACFFIGAAQRSGLFV